MSSIAKHISDAELQQFVASSSKGFMAFASPEHQAMTALVEALKAADSEFDRLQKRVEELERTSR